MTCAKASRRLPGVGVGAVRQILTRGSPESPTRSLRLIGLLYNDRALSGASGVGSIVRRASRLAGLEWSHGSVAGYVCMLLGVLYLASGVTYLLTPRRTGGIGDILLLAATSPGWYVAFYTELALTGLLGLAVVSPVSGLVAEGARAWTPWASLLAYLGFAVTAVQGVRLAVLLPRLGQLYVGCGTCSTSLADQRLLASWLYDTLPVDPQYWLIFGAVGLWIMTIALAGMRVGAFQTILASVGMCLALGLWLLVAGIVSGLPQIITVAAFLALILGLIWFVWLGLILGPVAAKRRI